MTEATNPKKRSRRSSKSHSPARPFRLWQDHSQNQEVRIEIVPMIDVIFCILTFFILGSVGLARQRAISLNLPKATTGTAQMREMLVVSLDDFGQVYVEKQLVTRNQLFEAIQNYHQFNPTGLMVLNASRNASYNEVIQVLDMLREVGGERVALATLPGDSSAAEGLSYPNLTTPLPGTNFPQGTPNPLLPNFPSDSNNPSFNTPPSNSSPPQVPPAP